MNDGKPRPLANGSGRILYPASFGFSKDYGRPFRPAAAPLRRVSLPSFVHTAGKPQR
ncbi:hypothetical protein B4135_0903 [Caldibacillus debilis]|uniref:Uncharacterized protein n=1 Tax=Caldibacillus debilis TaxID=301148 RepID=A0A150M5X1_9BACI|nr:hypothetical protein B4135_0903 [Caldibacillus debilis]